MHDYKWHGKTSLIAALDMKAGIVVVKCMQRHRAQGFRKFLDEVERNVPAHLDAYRHGKLRHAQNQAHPQLVRQRAELVCSLRADVGFLD
jgi:hypothetical protein